MKQFKIEIPTPCHEDWDKMTPESKGRFCGSCEKIVIDFTGMSAQEIGETLNKQKNVCGRFAVDQLEEIYTLPSKNYFYFPYQVAAASLLLFATPAFGQTVEPIKTEVTPIQHLIGDTVMVGTPLYIVPVKVVSEEGKSLENVLVRIQTKDGQILKEGRTDMNGLLDLQIEANDVNPLTIGIVANDDSFSNAICLADIVFNQNRILLIDVKRKVDRPMIMGKIAPIRSK